MALKLVKLDSINWDESVYPRNVMDWMTAYKYSQAMKTGAEFPPIVVATRQEDGKLIGVDGRHRCGAYQNMGEEHVQVEDLGTLSNDDIFKESIRRNAGHGRPLSSQERAKIIIKLKDMKLEDGEIAKLVSIPVEKLEAFVTKRTAWSLETEKKVVLKSPIRHLSENKYTDSALDDIDQDQGVFRARSQIQMLNELVRLLEGGYFDYKNDKIRESLMTVQQLIIKIQKDFKVVENEV